MRVEQAGTDGGRTEEGGGRRERKTEKYLSGLIVLVKTQRKKRENVWRAKSDLTNVTSVFPKGL